MDYKKLMGYGKEKKVIKKQPKPKSNKILESIQNDLNEWNDKTFKYMPKRWSGSGLTEFEKQGGKDTLKEVGMASDIKKYQKAIDKDMMNLAKSVNALKDLLIKIMLKKKLKN